MRLVGLSSPTLDKLALEGDLGKLRPIAELGLEPRGEIEGECRDEPARLLERDPWREPDRELCRERRKARVCRKE